MKRILPVIMFVFTLVLIRSGSTQVTLAIGDFKNDSEVFYLDSWEKSIPEFLKSELGKAEELTVVERQQLESVLQEQALSMTGLMDSATARTVGNLVGAQFIVGGKINQSGKWIRIDARIVQVATGEVRSVNVRSRDDQHVQEMAGLLANNIRSKLTGKVEYRSKVVLGRNPTLYFLGATAALGVGTILANNTYQDYLAKYHQATSLSEFDKQYDPANNWHQTRTVLIAVTATAAAVTLYTWIRNLSPDEILAATDGTTIGIIPTVVLNQRDYLGAGFIISF
jgi:TolB-like protein